MIVLHGTSSSGKTSLARALQAGSKRPLLHLEADRFAPSLRRDHPAAHDPEFQWRAVIAMHEAIAAFGRSGVDIIVDGSLPTEGDLRDRCLAVLRSVPGTRVVAVRCTAAALRAREAGREGRLAGWAEEQLRVLYEGVEFDAFVDTTDTRPEEAARGLTKLLFPA